MCLGNTPGSKQSSPDGGLFYLSKSGARSMYIPQHYRAEDQAEVIALIKANSFGILITSQEDVPFATHLPFLFDEQKGTQGVLISHLARANPQGQQLCSGKEVLVIFQGPHAYISPTWYKSEFNVPTWNYAIVHVYGQVRIVENAEQTRQMLDALVAQYEGSNYEAWRAPWDDTRYSKLTGGIIPFEIAISRIEGKFKLSQNKSPADRRGAIEHLQQSSDGQQQAIAAMMYQHLNSEEENHNV
jgi:transcriptional regulator